MLSASELATLKVSLEEATVRNRAANLRVREARIELEEYQGYLKRGLCSKEQVQAFQDKLEHMQARYRNAAFYVAFYMYQIKDGEIRTISPELQARLDKVGC